MRMIFVNLPVKSVKASRDFFGALGFTFNEQFCSEDTACMVIEENIFSMLMETARFKAFIKGDVADTAKGKEVLVCLSCASRAEVEALKAKAIAAGGGEWLPAQDYGFMYGDSFTDLDGHVWELNWMDPAAVAGGPPAA
ncbi:putative lactoylglutathione lyase [Caulobacter ginsengisoli]|uniref:Lactoylglutathione lyase n=1 Tax=Caulobacter ginsengisoli TaxID=400775 RepID=A0ABU0INW6_9CAUL|nr:VOC family protein [Caulobacter ginsengisoli]MDQ0463705.1 putative lactoylglutathione lyase [Caulobacter ginsengisoli]